MFTRAQRVLLALLVTACLVTGWVFQETIASIVFKWSDDTAYRHGFLIVPVVL